MKTCASHCIQCPVRLCVRCCDGIMEMGGVSVKSILRNTAFWDVDKSSLDMDRDRDFIICRILEYGTMEDVKALLEIYDMKDIEAAVRRSNSLSRVTASFWSKMLRISSEEINSCSTLPRYLRKQ